MHKSSYLRMEYLVHYYENYFGVGQEKVKVLDVGSCDVNGTYKDIFESSKYEYYGMDVCEGANVDIVLAPEETYDWKSVCGGFDLVISGQTFEHIEFPWLTIKEIARVLKPSGFCIITAPNSDVEHRYPTDCYRYFSDGLEALAKWADLKTLHVSVAGIPEKGVSEDWDDMANDAFLVAMKAPYYEKSIRNPFIYERRVVGEVVKTKFLSLRDALDCACQFGEDKRPIALFGAGRIGEKVLNLLGADRVKFFVDNDVLKSGKMLCGKEILSLQEFLKIALDYNCIITTGSRIAFEISEQLLKYGIKANLLYAEKEE